MSISTKKISTNCQETFFINNGEKISIGILNKNEAVSFAKELIDGASRILYLADANSASNALDYICENL